jgi:hypothetical protein
MPQVTPCATSQSSLRVQKAKQPPGPEQNLFPGEEVKQCCGLQQSPSLLQLWADARQVMHELLPVSGSGKQTGRAGQQSSLRKHSRVSCGLLLSMQVQSES